MKMLTTSWMQKQASAMLNSIDKVEYELNEEVREMKAFNGYVEGNTVHISILFNDLTTGRIGNIKLIDKDGDVVAVDSRRFLKPASKGIYIMFKYSFTEMEVDDIGTVQ